MLSSMPCQCAGRGSANPPTRYPHRMQIDNAMSAKNRARFASIRSRRKCPGCALPATSYVPYIRVPFRGERVKPVCVLSKLWRSDTRVNRQSDVAISIRRRLMLDSVATLLSFACCVHAVAQSTPEQRAEVRRKENYIFSTEPRRRSGVPRRDNITDEEVREVQSAAAAIYPDAIVNISTVTDGCECEGEDCTAQVWLVVYNPSRSRGLMLSRIGGHWQVGAVQEWWLRYYDLQTRKPDFRQRYTDPVSWRAHQSAWQAEEQDLVNSFPVCKTTADKRR